MEQERSPIPVTFFSMAVGTLAWGHAWLAAGQLWTLPGWWTSLASCAGLSLWLGMVLAYLRKWREHQEAARIELDHAVVSAMAALGPVSTLLAALSMKPFWPALAWVLYGVGLTAQLALGLWLVGRFWQGGRVPESINATAYLPAVAPNFVAATASASFGLPSLAALLFGAGVFSWLAMESLVMGRAALHSPVQEAQRPLQGIQIAPPVVGGLSYLSLTSGPPDLLAHMLIGYGLYQALLAARLLPWATRVGLVPSYWAYSFGVMAMATMALRMLARAPGDGLWQWLAPALFALANLVMAALLWVTVTLARQGRLLPALPTLSPSTEPPVEAR